MTGVLLNSGELKDYSALGDEGQPVYSVATQLREVIRARVGPAAANCLAIPKINENRSTVDWYANQSGTVVPWSAATPMERAVALESLDRYRQDVVSALGSISGVSGREQQIIQSLKDKVFTHPDNTCVFLVDGEPVLTFWGFHAGQAPMADPFFHLRPPPQAPAAAASVTGAPSGAGAAGAATVVTAVSRRPWWHWLLLALLLLALLFLLLRACAPSDTSSGTPVQPAISERTTESTVDETPPPALDTTTVEPEIEQTRPDAVSELEIVPSDQRVDRVQELDVSRQVLGDSVVELPDASGTTVVDDDGVALDAAQPMVDHTLMPEELATEELATEGLGAEELGTEAPETEVPGSEAPLPEAQPEALPTDLADAQAPDQVAPPEITDPDATPQPPSAQADTAAGDTAGGGPALGPRMQIPADATQTGSVSFLDGRWRAAGGLQDAKTGKPVRWYNFKDGKGTVTIEKAEGVRCQANASSRMDNGRLLIVGDGGVAQCTDGTSMALPTIACTPGQNGQADCTGVASDGKPLPIMIRQSP